MDQFEQFKHTFFQECDDLLSAFEAQLSALLEDPSEPELLNAAFRTIHSIKGGAGAFGFARLIAFTHTFETVLDHLRAGRISVSKNLIDVCLRAGDTVADLVHAARMGTELELHYEQQAAEQLAIIAGIDVAAPVPGLRAGSKQRSGDADGRADSIRHQYNITFRPHRELLRRANEPLLVVRNLRELGSLTVTADLSNLPAFADLVPTDAYLSWTFELQTSAGIAAVKEIFEFLEGSCDLSIAVVDGGSGTGAPIAELVNEAPDPIGLPSATPMDLTVTSNDTARATDQQPAPLHAAPIARISTIRVDLDRVDRLVNLVGEIAIAQAMVVQQIDQGLTQSNPRLFQDLQQLLQHTRNLQDSVMAIRAQPVRSIFARMPRVIRDLALQTGKKIALETSGESTEIDKTIIEELMDPLVHVIRNSVDHGIETAEERLAKGKPVHGTIRMSAAQFGSRIVIEVSDDGRGIDRDKVRQAAVRKGLIAGAAPLTNEEADNLILLPGLSTADSVSDISGRGVGMDVVNSNLKKLGGRVIVRSEPGRGTTTTLTLPLTLAVLDGMIVRSGLDNYVLPLGCIVECLAVSRQQVKTIPGRGEVLNVRGTHVRIVHLARVFKIASAAPASQLLVILVEVEGGTNIGLVVDEIVGQQQVVIKSVRENVGQIAGIAGATILGDGAVALILDSTAISELAAAREDRLNASTLDINLRKLVA